MARPEDILKFFERDALLDAVNEGFTQDLAVPVGPGDSGGTVYVSRILSASAAVFLMQNRKALVAVRKIVRNGGRRGVRKIRKRVRSLDLIDTRLFISAWKFTMLDADGIGISVDVSFLNAAPYAKYVHPKRTSRRRTFFNTDLPPILDEVAKEIREDITALFDRMKLALEVLTPARRARA